MPLPIHNLLYATILHADDVDALLERTVAYASGIVEVGGCGLGGRSERLDGIGLWGDVGNDFQALAVGHGE